MSFLRFFFLGLFFCMAIGCAKKNRPLSNQPIVLVSIAPYRFLVERIAGDVCEVQTIVPTASNPHSFEPTSQQVTAMGKAQIWFRIGEPFEGKIIPILAVNNAQLKIADLREGIELIEEDRELQCKHCAMDHLDRHIWLSPKLAQNQAGLIEKTLSLHFPAHREIFHKNYLILHAELTRLDEEISELLRGVDKRTFLVSHPAFAYFCKDYQLHQLSIEYEGKDPRPKHLEEILKRAISESAEIALALPQYNNKGAQLIAEKLHMPVRFIDPYSENYFEMMRKLAQVIADPYAN